MCKKMDKKNKVLNFSASENTYLHKDFHGALCYAIKYLDEEYGPAATTRYLKQVGKTCFARLARSLKRQGLSVMEEHLKYIFSAEQGIFDIRYDGAVLVLNVKKCPAISHLIKTKQLFTTRYCESTVVVNEQICKTAGYKCSCQYKPGEGICVQKFWKDKGITK